MGMPLLSVSQIEHIRCQTWRQPGWAWDDQGCAATHVREAASRGERGVAVASGDIKDALGADDPAGTVAGGRGDKTKLQIIPLSNLLDHVAIV
jgi:hypothetical protein